jgi:hypothetical protein
VSDLIASVADGYNVCIMAYGQTGSGKTYTMQGAPGNPGINMRALNELFQVGADREVSMRMQVQASILEIYNESIFDLLSDSPRSTADKLDIKEVGCALSAPCSLLCRRMCRTWTARRMHGCELHLKLRCHACWTSVTAGGQT